MLSIFVRYDHWARAARLADLNEWPDPGTKDIWTGKAGAQYGTWDGTAKFGVLAASPMEFNAWAIEGDLPAGYAEVEATDNGNTHNFVLCPMPYKSTL